VAKGYVVEAGAFQEVPLHVYQGSPAGTIRATAPDVGRFMLTHLQDGRTAQGHILQEATARQMRQTLFRPDPRLNGLAHGFIELDRNGKRLVGHLGSAAPAHYSLLALLPERGLGLFVAYNADTARPLTVGYETLTAFVDHFYPAPAAAPAVPPSDFAPRAGQYVGEYQRNNFGGSYTTVEKVGRLLGSATNRRISNPGDGTLEVASGLTGSTRFVEVAPDFFRQVDGPDALLFRRDQHGRVTSALFHGEPIYTFERLTLLETPVSNQALLLACVALFGSTLLTPTSVWIFRRQRVELRPTGFPEVARRVALATAVVPLLFLVGLFAALADPGPLMGDFSRLRLLLVLPLLGTVLAVFSVAFALLAWWRHFWSLPARLHYTAVAVAGVAFTWFLATWNLLGIRL
jgi:hypothetical protein